MLTNFENCAGKISAFCHYYFKHVSMSICAFSSSVASHSQMLDSCLLPPNLQLETSKHIASHINVHDTWFSTLARASSHRDIEN